MILCVWKFCKQETQNAPSDWFLSDGPSLHKSSKDVFSSKTVGVQDTHGGEKLLPLGRFFPRVARPLMFRWLQVFSACPLGECLWPANKPGVPATKHPSRGSCSAITDRGATSLSRSLKAASPAGPDLCLFHPPPPITGGCYGMDLYALTHSGEGNDLHFRKGNNSIHCFSVDASVRARTRHYQDERESRCGDLEEDEAVDIEQK